MTSFRNSSVKMKLILASVISSGAALLVVGALGTTHDLMRLKDALQRRLSIQADIVGANCVSALLFNDPKSAESTLLALKADPRIRAAGLYTPDRRQFATYLPPDARDATALAADLYEVREGYSRRDDRLILSRGILFDGKTIGTLLLVSDLGDVRAGITRDILVFSCVLLASLVLALLICSQLQRDISERILNLAKTARTVTIEKEYSVRASGESRDEIGALVFAFNDMLREIQEQQVALRAAHSGLERRVAERTSQLQAANSELEAFSYSVSHDLRAPLRHVSGFVDLLQRHVAENLDETGRRYLEVIGTSANRLGNLIDDLLVFSRMGRTEMSTSSVPLREVVSSVMQELQGEVDGRSIEWELGNLPVVQADPVMLRLVFQNLIGNAVKYTRTRPSARIEIGATEGAAGETIVFTRDNGVGFDMQYAQKLFGVFQRLHRAEEFEGTGIGLANVRRIIHRHGGATWAEAELGHGATFYFSLPKHAGVGDERIEADPSGRR